MLTSLLMTSLRCSYALAIASTYQTRQAYAKSLALSLEKHVIMSKGRLGEVKNARNLADVTGNIYG